MGWTESQYEQALERQAAYIRCLEGTIRAVLDRANGGTPELVYVGRDYTIGTLRRDLTLALDTECPTQITEAKP